jgi:hypothetical protein
LWWPAPSFAYLVEAVEEEAVDGGGQFSAPRVSIRGVPWMTTVPLLATKLHGPFGACSDTNSCGLKSILVPASLMQNSAAVRLSQVTPPGVRP